MLKLHFSTPNRSAQGSPLSHAVGEGLGVRAKKRARPAHSEPKRCTLIREDTGGEGNTARLPVHARAGKVAPASAILCRTDAPLSYQSRGRSLQLPPSCRFPPLREGNREGSVPPASRGNHKEGVINCCFFVNFGLAIGIRRRVW